MGAVFAMAALLALAAGAQAGTRELHAAVHQGDLDGVRRALEAGGADINDNAAANGAVQLRTPLMAATLVRALGARVHACMH